MRGVQLRLRRRGRWARVEPEALVVRDRQERTFTFADLSRLSNQAANAFAKLGIGKGDVVMMILRPVGVLGVRRRPVQAGPPSKRRCS
ncbi:MAG: AMP-binding protein [Eggerthellaceae bacterium]